MIIEPQIVNTIFSIGIVLVQIDILVILLALLWKKDGKIVKFVREHALWLVLFAAVAAIVGSLTYSEILGYTPCKLCWFQRILIYPQALIALIAIITKDRKAVKYTFWMSLVGILISINHYILQVTGVSFVPCSTVGYSAACSGKFVMHFGYITIPLMCATLYAYSLTASSIALFSGKNKKDE